MDGCIDAALHQTRGETHGNWAEKVKALISIIGSKETRILKQDFKYL
jgi:hypothetical protein